MSSESHTAFYKALKFWIAFVLAAMAAALVWRLMGVGASSASAEDAPGYLGRK